MDNSHWFSFLLAILFDARLAEIISVDNISQPIRKMIGRKINKNGDAWWWLSELVNCPYCVGVWIALPLGIIIGKKKRWWLYWLAIAGGQALLESAVNGRD